MMPIQISEPDPTLDALAKLYTLYIAASVTLREADEKLLTELSDHIYALDAPVNYVFTDMQKAEVERLWQLYAVPKGETDAQ